MMKRWLLMAMIGFTPALGQSQDGALIGRIREPGGSPVPAVRVTLTRVGGSNVYTAVTNNDGLFRVGRIRPGQYTLVAGAIMATILPGTADASQAVVYTARPSFLPPESGTFFPGTADASQAQVITVASDAANANLDFALAAGAWSDLSLQAVHGRIVVEGGDTPALNSDEFSLFLSNGPGNRATDVTFLDRPRKPAATSTRLETSPQGFQTITSAVPMPAFPDGAFRIFVRDGVYRVIQPAPATLPLPGHYPQELYYVKAMSFGGVDLMKNLMTVQGPSANEFVITLAKCTAATQDPLCP